MSQGLAEALSQPGARRPANRGEAVEVGAALGRRTLDQRQAIRREDRHRRAVAGRGGGVDRTAVE